ncbi:MULTISPECIES: phosphatase PAP2 family protein [Halocynthiibacter]|uniref:Phosphatase PAP2 family protein n=1 Tax=Halocynthiibacter halioticoli TaxID=2986804 RepID=A0AAE3J404_9RHOB|nr:MULTISPECIES: phosphatase PAP2 family protein [Halocynthiibacter]MCV6825347.1 phosphatase PAP2 family protein [Halocynthiibacter halioticoli]MCW4058348.1 phosphatase PAP2 family protein [Halocynthiibacter sp. SDUM655004]
MQPYLQKLVLAFLFTLMVFTTVPKLDLWATGLFYVEGVGFPAAQNEFVVQLRFLMMRFMLLLPIIALVMLVVNIWKRGFGGIPAIVWGKILTLFLLGPGLLVNGILKEYWGRARPEKTQFFGGSAEFTPPFQITDQCSHNCSFVSGEASGATAVAISLFALSYCFTNEILAKATRIFAIAFAVIASSFRVIMGRHFLSDTIFAILMVLLVSYAINAVFSRIWPPKASGASSARQHLS